jgi:hypothetical protein
MQTRKTKPNKDWLVGTWEANAAYIPVRFTIDKTAQSFRIQAVDQSDGEELIVSNIRWSGNVLTFETLTPSNGWRTGNRLKVLSDTKAVHELTIWEEWAKVRPKARHRTRSKH